MCVQNRTVDLKQQLSYYFEFHYFLVKWGVILTPFFIAEHKIRTKSPVNVSELPEIRSYIYAPQVRIPQFGCKVSELDANTMQTA